ncbi:MAG: efflux RND transporter periplasmic adaptor subunit [Brevinemataceae bacterium]
MSKKKKKIIIITVAVVALLGIIFIFRSGNSEQDTQSIQRTTVLVRKAKAGSLKRFLDLYAELKAKNEVDLTSPVTGKIFKINRLEGQSVARGQSVVLVDRFEIGARYAPAPVLSPVNGVVTRILLTEGADVTIGMPIASVGNMNVLEAKIQVPELYVPEVKVGQIVYFQTRAVPDRVFEGKIIRKDLSLNPSTRSLVVRAEISNKDQALFSGIFAESFIFVEEATNVYVVPESALTKTKEGEDAIFINQNDIAVLRPVKISLRYRDQVAISEGIQEDDQMVVFGREYLNQGSPIRVLEEEELVNSNTLSIPSEDDK